MLAGLYGLTAQAPEGTPPHATSADWRGLGLMQLLKRATRRRSSAALPASALDLAAPPPPAPGPGAGSGAPAAACKQMPLPGLPSSRVDVGHWPEV